MKTYLLGTAIYFSVILPSEVDSIKITIVNEAQAKQIDAVDMSVDENLSSGAVKQVYAYTYQTAITNIEGVYVAVIETVASGVTSVQQQKFRLVKRY